MKHNGQGGGSEQQISISRVLIHCAKYSNEQLMSHVEVA